MIALAARRSVQACYGDRIGPIRALASLMDWLMLLVYLPCLFGSLFVVCSCFLLFDSLLILEYLSLIHI